MKRLVIHPKDPSTEFLKGVYEGRDDVSIVTGGYSRGEIMEMVKEHDQVMLIGHGTGYGLLSIGQFSDACGYPGYVVDDSFAPLLAEKDNTVFIWCYSDQYVERNRLHGFYTGMFISEPLEAYYCGLRSIQHDEIEESNHAFADTVSRYVDRGARLMHAATRHEYGRLARKNRIAAYNHKRLYAYYA